MFWEIAGPAAKLQDPLISPHPSNAGLDWCNGKWQPAFGSFQLLKHFSLSAQRRQNPGGVCLQDPSHCRYKAYILLTNMLGIYIRALSAASSVGLVAQHGMAPWGRYAPAQQLHSLFSKGNSFTSSPALLQAHLYRDRVLHTHP